MYYIYKILCKANGKVYIGQTMYPEGRFAYHKKALSINKHTNPNLQSDYNFYGASQFTYNILETCETTPQNLLLETKWINYYGGINSQNTYNVKGNGPGQDNKDYAAKKRSYLNPTSFANHKHSEQSKLQISKSVKQTRKERNIQPVRLYGEDNGFYGKHHTKEVCEYISKLRSSMRKYTSEQIDLWISMFNAGGSYEDISKQCNVPIGSLKYIIHNKERYLKYGLNRKGKKCNDYPVEE